MPACAFFGGITLDDVFQIGKIVNTQGLKGEVRVFPTTDEVRRFDALQTIVLRGKNGLQEIRVERVRYQKNLVIIKLAGIDDISQAELLRGSEIVVPRAEALPLDADEYYFKDILGMAVVTSGGEALGNLDDILTTGANDVYVVRNAETGEEILIPAIKQCVLRVDADAKVITVSLLEGLRGL